MLRNWVMIAILLLPFASAVKADVITENFETFADGDVLTNQSAGMLFSNAVVLAAGVSLNDAEFPPHSGNNVATDNGGPMSITFSDLAVSFSAYFTYLEPLTLTAYDASNNVVGTVTSLFSGNYVSTGNPPNELISLNVLGGFSSLVISADPFGGSFVIDDISVTTQAAGPVSGVPEPSSVAVLAVALGLLVLTRKLAISRDTGPRSGQAV